MQPLVELVVAAMATFKAERIMQLERRHSMTSGDIESFCISLIKTTPFQLILQKSQQGLESRIWRELNRCQSKVNAILTMACSY